MAKTVWCAPGNPGIAGEKSWTSGEPVKCVPVGAEDLPALLRLAGEIKPDLTVVGPDNPLSLGIVDLFQSNGFKIWGPNRQAALFESSKAFAQGFMERHRIPTARSGVFDDPVAAKKFAAELHGRCAVKADGLAFGKGVIIALERGEAEAAIDEILVRKTFGEAGRHLVIQEYLEGMEVSLHALCDGKTALLFPSSQDHKRIFENDEGPNTGGMGTFAPTPFLNARDQALVQDQILNPWLEGCREEGIDYRGILYPGIMLTKDGPKVLEFNARFGDPETQVYLKLLQNDLLELLVQSVEGSLGDAELQWKEGFSVCVIMASKGYPSAIEKGFPISGIAEAESVEDLKVFHAGTRMEQGSLVNSGGRVLGVTGWGKTLEQARDLVYEGVEKIKFEGSQIRRDIGSKAM